LDHWINRGLGRGRFDAAIHGVPGQLEGRQVPRIVDAAGDDGLVRVALLEGDDDFLAGPGPEEAAPAFAGPDLGDAYPAGAVRVVGADTVPVELHLDPAVLVDEDRLVRQPGHRRRLGAGDDRPRRGPGGSERQRGGLAGEAVAVVPLRLAGPFAAQG